MVRTVTDGPGSQELLAVGTYSGDPHIANEANVSETTVEESGTQGTAAGESGVPRVSGPLSLPYTLPA